MAFQRVQDEQSEGSEIALFSNDGEAIVIPEASLLFQADFERDGPDLLLVNDTQSTIRIVAYFNDAVPADLESPEGAVLRGSVVEKLAGPLAPAQVAQVGAIQSKNPIGQVEDLTGNATVQRADGTVEPLADGAYIFENDVVQTADGSSLSITFVDGTIFTLASASRMVLDSLIYDPQGSANSGVFNLIEGSFVFIAGQIAKTGGFDVNTPTATMGIRGTTVKVDIESTNGVTTVSVSLKRDPDGGIGSFTITDLDGNVTPVTVTGTKLIISPGQEAREIEIGTQELASDQALITRAVSAFQAATNRVESGSEFVPTDSNSSETGEQQDDGPGNEGTGEENNTETQDNGESGTGGDGQDSSSGEQQGNLGGGSSTNEFAEATNFGNAATDIGGGSGGTGLGSGIAAPAGSVTGPAVTQTTDIGDTNTAETSGSSIASQPIEGETPTPEPAALTLDVPVITTSVEEDGGITISGFSITAPATASLTATLVAGSTVTIAPGSGVTLLQGTGVEDDVVVIQGTAQQLNDAFNGTAPGGGLIYNPSPNEDDEATLEITITDGVNVVSSLITLDITPVQDPPTAEDDTVTLVEDGNLFVGNVLSNDSDPDTSPTPDVLSVVSATTTIAGIVQPITFGTAIALESGALFILNADGSFSFDQNSAFNGLTTNENATETVIYQITDGNGNFDTGTLTLTVNGVNDAATLSGLPSDITAVEDVASNVDLSTAVFEDVDGDELTVSLTLNAGTFLAPADGTALGVTATLVSPTQITLSGLPDTINTFLDTPSNIQFLGPQNVNGDNAAILSVGGDVAGGTVNIDISAVDDPSLLADFGSDLTVNEQQAPVFIDNSVTFTDTDSSFDGGTLVISGLVSDDIVSVNNQGAGAGQIGLVGSAVTFGGVIIATLSGGTASNLVVTFNAQATSISIEALIENLTFQNTSDTPVLERELSIAITDSSGTLATVQEPAFFTEQTGVNNPFDSLGIDNNAATGRVFPQLVDLDGDGDLDLVVDGAGDILEFFENTGTVNDPVFTQIVGTDNPFNDFGGLDTTPVTFGDIDGDGDLDAFLVQPGGGAITNRFLENIGSATNPDFTDVTGAGIPATVTGLSPDATPVLVDIDNDGDLDLFAGSPDGSISFFENTGSESSAEFTEVTGVANPLDGVSVLSQSAPTFIDIDGDGDFDVFIGDNTGQISSLENTGTAGNASFTARTGTDNPFNGVDIGNLSTPVFADIDGDGDADAIIGESFDPSSNGGLNFFENQDTDNNPTPTITVLPVNDLPTVNNLPGDVTVIENLTSNLVLSNVIFNDVDNDQLTVTLTVNLGIFGPPADGSAGPFGGVVATLVNDTTVTVAGSSSAINAFLSDTDSISYTGPVGLTGDNAALLSVSANDGSGDLALGSVNIDINPANTAPALSGLTATAITIGSTPTILDSDVTLVDPDDNFDGGTLTVSGLVFGDTISINNQGTGVGEIGLLGSAVTFSGVTIGTLTDSGGTDFLITFNAQATTAIVEQVIENLTFQNTNADPVATRNLQVTVTDADGASSVIANAGNLTFSAASNPFDAIVFGSDISVGFADLDNDGDLDAFVGNNNSSNPGFDFLENQGTAANPVFVANNAASPVNDITTNGFSAIDFVDIDFDGDLDAFVGQEDGTFEFFQNDGTVSAANFVQQTIFNNPANGIDIGNRSIASFVDLDNDGDQDLVSGNTDGTLSFIQNDGTVANPDFQLQDPAGANNPFNGIDVGINSAPTFTDFDGDGDFDLIVGNGSGDLNFFLNTGTDETPVFTEQTGVNNPVLGLTDIGNTRPAFADLDGDGDEDLAVGTVADNIVFFENNTGASNSLLPVTLVNAAFQITSDAGVQLDYTENGPPAIINNTLLVTDPDNVGLVSGATISISSQFEVGDILNFINTATISGTYNTATGTLTLTGSDTIAAYQEALRSITYESTSDTVSDLVRTIEFQVFAGLIGSAPAISAINPTSVNDAPEINPGQLLVGISADVGTTDIPVSGLQIEDPDAGSGEIAVTLSAAVGTINVQPNTTGGLPAANIIGSGTGFVTLTGTIAQINTTLAILAAVTFTPPATLNGTVNITVNVDDNGNSGSGVAQSDSQIIPISLGFNTQTGTGGADTLNAAAGSNTLIGLGGSDTLTGGTGNDFLFGGEGGADLLDGGAGIDLIDGGGDLDPATNARTAFDQVRFASATTGIVVNLNEGAVFEDGTGVRERIANIESVFTTPFNDIVIGGNVNNNFFELFRSSAGNDLFDGGSGFDRARFDTDPDSILVNLSSTAQTFNVTTAGGTVLTDFVLQSGTARDGFGGIDTLRNIESIQGSNFNDVLIGSSGNDQFRPQAGNDQIDGGDGDRDELNFAFTGGTQGININLATGTANDTFGDTDTFTSIEEVRGSQFDDVITGSSNDEFFLLSEGGTDTFDGAGGTDTITFDTENFGGAGVALANQLQVNLSTSAATVNGVTLAASTALDPFFGNPSTVLNIENVTGTLQGDLIVGSASNNVLLGREGDDFIEGLGGNDLIDGGGDFDVAAGGRTAFDHVSFANASSGVALNFSNQTVTANGITIAAQSAQDGDGGIDTILNTEGVFGSAFNDTLIGGNVDNDFFELFRSSAGADFIDGGSGFDRVRFREDPNAVITNVSGSDQLVTGFTFADGTVGNITVSTDSAIDGFNNEQDQLFNIESFQGSNFNDFLFGSNLDEQFRPQGGDDFIAAGGGVDELDFAFTGGTEGAQVNLATGTANDTFGNTDTFTGIENLRGSRFADTLTGDDNDNLFRLSEGGNDSFTGAGGIDTIIFDNENLGGAGLPFTTFNFGSGGFFAGVSVNLSAGTASDNIGFTHTLDSIENVTGSLRGDTLVGDDQDNVLIGRDGEDTLTGNAGNDVIDGGDDFDAGVGGRSFFDQISFSNATQGVLVNFSNVSVNLNGTDIAAQSAIDGQLTTGGVLGVDTVTNVEGAFGTQFDDVLVGGNIDNDGFEIFRPLAGNDIIDGGSGFDRLRYTATSSGGIANTGIIVNASSQAVTERGITVQAGTAFDGFGGTDTFFNIESFQSGSGDDFLFGGAGDEQFRVAGGTDFVNGGDGNDEIDFAFTRFDGVGSGVFVDLQRETAIDTFGNTDTLISIENVRGSGLDDILLGSDSDNLFRVSTGGNDLFDGREGVDEIRFDYESLGGIGLVFENGVTINLENEAARGSDGASLTVLNIENVTGSLLDDQIIGDGEVNRLDGRAGDDQITGDISVDTLIGGLGQDTLVVADNGLVDLSGIATGRISSFERLDLDNGLANNIVLSISDVLGFSEAANDELNALLSTSLTDTFIIDGDSQDNIDLDPGGGNIWQLNVASSSLVEGFNVFNIIEGGSGDVLAALAIDDEVTTTISV